MSYAHRAPRDLPSLLLSCLLSCLPLLSGCTDDVRELTQVTARIYVEPQVVDAMDRIRFRLSAMDGEAWTQRELLAVPKDNIDLYPIDVPITPRDGKTDRVFEVVVDAFDEDGRALVQARAITGFVAGEVRVLEMWLEVCGDRELGDLCETDPNCFGTDCAVCLGSTCVDVTPMTSATSLLSLDPNDTPDANKRNPERRDTGSDRGIPAPQMDGGTKPLETMDAAQPDPCQDDPCGSDGECAALTDTSFECLCDPGFFGDRCEVACDIKAAAGPALSTEQNHVRGAALYMSSQRAGGAVVTCDGACAAAYAADGERCGELSRAPVAFPAVADAGQNWIADWSAGGARRIDRIEIYNVRGTGAAALNGAEVRVDGFVVGTYPDDAPSHALLFDPPLYGSSVEIVQLAGTAAMGLAEVEVWGPADTRVRDVALHGAARQSSVLAVSEAISTGGGMADAAPSNAVDGRFDTVAVTKPFRRGGSVELKDLVQGSTASAYPYDTGNRDEAPLTGSNNAWWYLELGRAQRVHALHISRGDNPARLAGAKVYLEIDGTLEGSPRFVLPDTAEFGDVDRLQPATPVGGVTGVKIVSAIVSIAAASGPDPDASLELREVRVWADVPSAAVEPLRDLSFSARAQMLWTDGNPFAWTRSPGVVVDGAVTAVTASTRVAGAWMRLDFGAAHELTRADFYKHPAYPGTFYYAPPATSCPRIPLCGDTYGTCARRMNGAQVFGLDAQGAIEGGALATLGAAPIESLPISAAAAHGLEVSKAMAQITTTAACPSGYGDETVINLLEWRVFGYPKGATVRQVNYAGLGQAPTATLSPALAPIDDHRVERALSGSEVDYASSDGVGPQELSLLLRRAVLAESIRVVVPTATSVDGATLQARLDGGTWQAVATLGSDLVQVIALSGDALLTGVRVLREDAPIEISELEVLAPLAY